MINRTKLLGDLKVQVRDLEADLRARFASNNDYRSRLTADWQAARDAGRTSEDVSVWAEAQFTQSAIAWVLACVFVRFCEDNALLDAPLLVGTDARGQSAVARQEAFYLQNPGAILRAHVEAFSHDGLAASSDAATQYLRQHAAAIAFAQLNRASIAARLLRALRTRGQALLDITHNHVIAHHWRGEDGFLHRKGATPADQGLVVIPGSRGDYSYLVEPVPSAQSLFSLAHGAGRKWLRSDCKGRLATRFSFDQLKRTQLGSRVICEDRGLMYEEAPEAYKSIDSVVGSLRDAGLVKVIARLKPVLTYKRRGCC